MNGKQDRQVAADAGERLLAIVRDLARELRPQMAPDARLALDDSLERDIGLDSLARVELVLRIEREFAVKLAEAAFATAETPRDLLRLIAGAGPGSSATAVTPSTAEASPGEGDVTPPPESLATVVEALDWHVANHPERVSITLYGEDERRDEISYRALRSEAVAVAAGLATRGFGAGDRVAIILPTGREFFAAFYGALYAGCVPVPIYPPARLSQIEDHLRRIAGIVANAGAVALITIDRAKPLAHLLRAQGDCLRAIVTVTDLGTGAGPPPQSRVKADDIAFLQYTSGSTGNPKGVVLTHANLLANLRAMGRAAGVDGRDTFVSWLPLYHDMGLIGACLGSMFVGFHLVLMSPLAFLARPGRWLRAIDEHRATLSAAPNFAYELCANKLTDSDIADLDLRCWRLAFNGAEPVGVGTIERFAARFAAAGFAPQAMTPVYGLAESSVGLAFPPLGRGPRIDRIDRRALIDQGVARPGADENALAVVACGLPLPAHEIRIADAAGRELAERRQGRVQFRGPSACAGYYGNPAATARLIEDDWLNTGDLGYLADGELFITGREKDVIIRAGHNIHPQELEDAANKVPGVRKGGVAVFPATDPRIASERLIVLAETEVSDAAERARIVAEISRLAVDLTGGPADDIVLAPPRTVRKTSSGKIRRAACRDLYESGDLGRAPAAPWRQFVRLTAAAVRTQLQRHWRSSGEWLWATWFWFVLVTAAVPVVALILVVPGLGRRRRVVSRGARLVLACTGLAPRVSGNARRAGSPPAVYVANHASYLDSLILAAVLPPEIGYVSKQELSSTPLFGTLLERLGCPLVERFDAARGVEHTRDLEARGRAGESLLFFAEGTFYRMAGLLPFRQGAFVVAAHAGVPVVPVTLIGTRVALRDGQWRPQRVRIEVCIGEAIEPTGADWQAAIMLRDAARRQILLKLGEPDLAN